MFGHKVLEYKGHIHCMNPDNCVLLEKLNCSPQFLKLTSPNGTNQSYLCINNISPLVRKKTVFWMKSNYFYTQFLLVQLVPHVYKPLC